MADARGILVLGMYRSGTSALTGLLRLLGVHLGDRLMPPAAANPKGFWEHEEVVAIDEDVLSALGRSTFDPREMPRDWRHHPAVAAAIPRIRALAEGFAQHPLWAVKDPRLCRLAPMWREALEPTQALAAILVVRHPAEVVQSMRAQGWISSSSRAYLSWLQYLLEAERATRGLPRALVSYDALLRDCRGVLAGAGDALGLAWAERFDAGFADIAGFLDHGDRHYRAADVAAAMPPPLWVEQAYAICAAEGPTDWAALAAFGERYAEAAGLFGPALDEALVELTLTRLESDQARASSSAADDRG